jgi:hypothetical protein
LKSEKFWKETSKYLERKVENEKKRLSRLDLRCHAQYGRRGDLYREIVHGMGAKKRITTNKAHYQTLERRGDIQT